MADMATEQPERCQKVTFMAAFSDPHGIGSGARRKRPALQCNVQVSEQLPESSLWSQEPPV